MKKLILVFFLGSISIVAQTQDKSPLKMFNDKWIEQLRIDCYKMSFNDVKQQNKYVDLFSSSEGQQALKGIYDYYTNIRLGLWEVNDKSEEFMVSELKDELLITITSTVERNFTKEEQKSIKGKAFKESYKSSKYHQTGIMKYTLLIKLIGNTPKVVDGVEAQSLHVIR